MNKSKYEIVAFDCQSLVSVQPISRFMAAWNKAHAAGLA